MGGLLVVMVNGESGPYYKYVLEPEYGSINSYSKGSGSSSGSYSNRGRRSRGYGRSYSCSKWGSAYLYIRGIISFIYCEYANNNLRKIETY